MAEPTSAYSGWLPDPGERQDLLARFPPRHPIVVAHHATLEFGDEPATAPTAVSGEILGWVDDGKGVQALVLALDSGAHRPDGAIHHITWSLAEKPGKATR